MVSLSPLRRLVSILVLFVHGAEEIARAVYKAASGREPVREWLKELPVEDRKVLGEDIKDVEFAWPLGLPLVRPLGRGLWEVRSSLAHGRIARVIFCISDGQLVLLHGFLKKTQKTPVQEIDLALKRMRGQEG